MKAALNLRQAEVVVVLTVGLLYFLVAAWPSLQSDWISHEDAAQHLIWLHDVNWPETIYTDVSRNIQPWGVQFLHSTLALVFSPYFITIWLPLPLTLITIGFAFVGARKYSGFLLSLSFSLLVTHYAYSELAGGFARSFCIPLLVVFWSLVSQAKWRAAALVILLSGLFYPTAALICMGCLTLLFLWSLMNQSETIFPRFWSKNFKLLLISGLLATGVMFAKSYSLQQHPFIGPFHSLEYIKTAPEFGSKGRVRFAHELKTTTPNMLRYTIGRRLKLPKEKYSLYGIASLNLLLAALLLLMRKRLAYRKSIMSAFRCGLLLLISAMLGHYFAQILAPHLFIPDRFLSYPSAFFTAFALWFPLAAILVLIERKSSSSSFSWAQLPSFFIGLTALIFLVSWMPNNPKIKGRSVGNYNDLAPLFEAVRKLPESALIVAPSVLADQLTFQGQRSVFLSHELAHALYFSNYHKITDTRWRAYLPAYLSGVTEKKVLIDFLKNNNISHILIDTQQLSKGKFQAYFEPYRSISKDILKEKSPDELLLNNIPSEIGQTILSRFRLIEANDLIGYLDKLAE